MGFLRKVYGLLAAQLTITTMIAAACLFTPAIKETIHAYPGLVMVAFFASIGLPRPPHQAKGVTNQPSPSGT